jgi:hypothetical protein
VAGQDQLAHAAPPVEGEYLCDGCNGYMTVKKNGIDTYQVRVVVGGGSCGGEEFSKGLVPLVPGNRFLIPWKQGKKKCTTQIEIKENKASVSDSCISADEEAGSTCAVLGEYLKRGNSR